MDEVLNLFWQIREKPGSSVTLKLWNDGDGRDGFILSLLPSPGGGKRRRRGTCQQGHPPPVRRGGRPETYASAVKTPTINVKTLADAKSLADAKKTEPIKNSSDAKWSKDARRIAYAKRRANAARPVSLPRPLDAAETVDAEKPVATTRPVDAAETGDAEETGNAEETGEAEETGDAKESGDAEETGDAAQTGDAAERSDAENYLPPALTTIPQLDGNAPDNDDDKPLAPDPATDPELQIFGVCTNAKCMSCKTYDYLKPLPDKQLCNNARCVLIHWHIKSKDCSYIIPPTPFIYSV